ARCPGCKRTLLWEPVEGVVDLDGIERSGVAFEPTRPGNGRRVKIATPVLVLPARATDSWRRHRRISYAMRGVFWFCRVDGPDGRCQRTRGERQNDQLF